MNFLDIHRNLATAVIIFNALLGVWGLIKYLRGENFDGQYAGAVALSPILGLIQLAVGLYMVSLGLGVNVRFVHYLYGALVIIAAPAVFAFTRGRDDRGVLIIYALVLLITSGFAIRGFTTGYEAIAP
jgi:heme A synthase